MGAHNARSGACARARGETVLEGRGSVRATALFRQLLPFVEGP